IRESSTSEDLPMADQSYRPWQTFTRLFRKSPSRRKRPTKLTLEHLEDRVVPTLTVTTFADVVDPNDGRLSLREAIQQANSLTTQPNAALPGEAIIFQSGGTVNLQAALPEVTGTIYLLNQTGASVTVRRASATAFSIF